MGNMLKIILTKFAFCFRITLTCLMLFLTLGTLTESCSGCTICKLFETYIPPPCHCGSGRRPAVFATNTDMVVDQNEAYKQNEKEWKAKEAFWDQEDEEMLLAPDGCAYPMLDCQEEEREHALASSSSTVNFYEPLITDYKIGVGDVLEISVLGDEDMLAENVTVAPDGRIYYMFLEGIVAEGRTLEDLRAELESKMTRLFLTPTITIIPQFMSDNSFTILGRVRAPGLYPLEQTTTLRQAIGVSGGVLSDLEIFHDTFGGLG